MVMDYGAPFAGRSEDQRSAEIFLQAGLPVASVLEAAPDPGCLVIEDLGRQMLEDALEGTNDQGEPPELLLRAAELAGRVARDGTAVLAASDRANGPALDGERFRFEMDYFLENFVGNYKKITADQGVLRVWLYRLADAAAGDARDRVLCHRDFHSRNLMVATDGSVVMVDIQDARWGPDTYDLASLAFDAYLDRPDRWLEPMLKRFLSTAGCGDDDALRERLHRVAAQRMIKALGTFGYQTAVAGKRRYLQAIPRTLARLDRWLPRRGETGPIHEAFRALGLFQDRP